MRASGHLSVAQFAPPIAAFAAYRLALVTAYQIDRWNYNAAFDTPPGWLDPLSVWHSLRPALPLACVHLLTPMTRWFWLWLGWGTVLIDTFWLVYDAFHLIDPKLRILAVNIYALPFLTWPITAIVLILAWRDRLLARKMTIFR